MARIRHSAEQIIGKLREAEVLLGQGHEGPRGQPAARRDGADVLPVAEGVRRLKTDQAKKLKELERENARLKKLVATWRWTRRCCRKSPRETSEPAPEA
jgi:putative transposase